MSKKITILGGGAWGTAMATVLAGNGHSVTLWCFEQEVVEDIINYRINEKYLSGVELAKAIEPTSCLHEAIEGADILFEAIPVMFLRKTVQDVKEYLNKKLAWVALSKGIEHETGLFPTDIIKDVLGPDQLVAVLSGPNFARQIAHQAITATQVASKDETLAREVQALCENSFFKPAISHDVIGVQVGGALKNVISMFLGMLDGVGYLENTRAFFLTRGLAEVARFAEYLGGEKETVYGFSGLGDLLLGLLGGERNRNYRLGELLGKGNSLSDIESMMKVIPEGINTAKSLHAIIQKNRLDLPICSAVYQIICDEMSVRRFVESV
ncbi:NAD(P)-dependent glycerol-3-phosphate dehydrogenase [Candidatus Dependentiae bacterium]|nr:NAD(P)-dependent glycerol-3-phosphate dehydrogenase [Candidatus Dependentiae bacterium]